MRHHHQRPAVHPLTQPGFGRVRRSNSTSIRSTKRPRSARAPLGRCSRATSRSSRPSSISMPGLSPGPIRYRPGCLKAHSNRLRASATASGHRYSASTRRTAARVRADTPEIRRTGRCLGGRHRSARTAFGRLRGIALSDQNHGGILPRSAPSERGNRPDPSPQGLGWGQQRSRAVGAERFRPVVRSVRSARVTACAFPGTGPSACNRTESREKRPHLGAAPGAQHHLPRVDGDQRPESVPLRLCAVELSTDYCPAPCRSQDGGCTSLAGGGLGLARRRRSCGSSSPCSPN